MNAQDQAISSSVSIEASRAPATVFTPRTKYVLAQASMVFGYLIVMMRPLDGDVALAGIFFETIALLLYVMSKR